MNLRPPGLDALEHLHIKRKRQRRMATPDDMNLGDGLGQPSLHLGEDLPQGHLIGPLLPCLLPEGAEFTAIDADVGIIEVLVVNIKCLAAVEALPHDIRQITHPQEVRTLKKGKAVLRGEPFTLQDLLINRKQRGIGQVESRHFPPLDRKSTRLNSSHGYLSY